MRGGPSTLSFRIRVLKERNSRTQRHLRSHYVTELAFSAFSPTSVMTNPKRTSNMN